MKNLDQILSEVTPILETIEGDRQTYYRRRGNCIWFVIVPLICFAGILGFYFFPVGLFALIPAIIISGIVYHFMAGKYAKAYAENYKQCVVTELVKEIDPNLNYDLAQGIEMSAFVETELFTTRPDRYSTEDLIHGVYDKTGFQLAEVHAEDKRESTDSDGNRKTTYVTIFKGLILIADFHKNFQGRTFVFPDVAEKALGGLGREILLANQRVLPQKAMDTGYSFKDPHIEAAMLQQLRAQHRGNELDVTLPNTVLKEA